MTGRGKRGKPKAGFPLFPPPLEIATRFPHSHSLDDDLAFALHNFKERSPGHYLNPLGSSFNENMLERLRELAGGMRAADEDPDVIVAHSRMHQLIARKPLGGVRK